MALLQTEAYFALKAAGAPESEAREAAEAAADIDIRHTVMAERLNGLDSKLNWIGATTIALNMLNLSATLALAWQVLQRLPVR